MSVVYTSGTFTSARVIDHWIEYPFLEFDDNTTKIYYLKCQVNTASYSPLVVGTGNLTSAATAGVISLPSGFTDANARFINDSPPQSISGGQIQFVRKFANIPEDHNEYDGLVVDLPKAYDDGTNDILFDGGPTDIPTRFAYTFAASPTGFTINPKFQITYLGYEVNFVRDTTAATVPTRTQFYGSDTERVAEPTKVRRWMGDIYYAVTPYITPDNAYDATP